jgi:peptidoglycan/LPS O-acetylase OafA/YrhL
LPLFAGVDAVLQAIGRGDIHTISPLLGLPVVAVILVLSWLIDRYYDRPIRRWLTARTRRTTSGVTSATPATG